MEILSRYKSEVQYVLKFKLPNISDNAKIALLCRISRQTESLEWSQDINIASSFVIKVTPTVCFTALVMALSWCAWRTSTRRLQEKTWSMKPWWGNPVSWPTTLPSTWFGSRSQREAGGHPSDHSMPLGKPFAWWENKPPGSPNMSVSMGNVGGNLLRICWKGASNCPTKIHKIFSLSLWNQISCKLLETNLTFSVILVGVVRG